jgi:hypothetical protein
MVIIISHYENCSDDISELYKAIPQKVKLSLCLIKHYAMKTYGGVEV